MQVVQLNLKSEAQYPGDFLESKLLWKKTEILMKKTEKHVIDRIYRSIVRPILTYWCIVWWEAMRNTSYRNTLTKAQICTAVGTSDTTHSTPY